MIMKIIDEVKKYRNILTIVLAADRHRHHGVLRLLRYDMQLSEGRYFRH
ncbi:MAG: hypothetical protein MZV70_55235 [Desulfobacterales bacterium]|nr:hypothetical protein [Desulfobacterales bacterium]